MGVNGSNRTLDRERILAVASRHFCRYGFRKTALADVARELGVVKGALYYHFPGGKLELFDAAASAVEERFLNAMQQAADRERDPLVALRAIFAAKYEAIRAALAELGVEPDVARELVAVPRQAEHFQAGERALIKELLARGERDGRLRRIRSREATSAAIQAMLREPLLLAALAPEAPAEGQQALPRELFDVLIHGLAADSGRRAEVSR